MSFSYDKEDLSDDVNKLRFRINDTDSTDYLFSDEELQSLLDNNFGDIYFSMVEVYMMLAQKYSADSGDEVRVGEIEYNEGKSKAKYYTQLAENLRDAICEGRVGSFIPYTYAGGVSALDRELNDQAQVDGIIVESTFSDAINDFD